MRQIEDRWRINLRDPPNVSEMYLNLINQFTMNPAQKSDVSAYTQRVLRNYINGKCSSACLTMDKLDYKSCIENCNAKLLQSDKLMAEGVEEFNQRSAKFGKNLFLN
jgi:hypothetical protein